MNCISVENGDLPATALKGLIESANCAGNAANADTMLYCIWGFLVHDTLLPRKYYVETCAICLCLSHHHSLFFGNHNIKYNVFKLFLLVH